MSKILKLIFTCCLLHVTGVMNSQTLHKLSKNLTQVNKEFQFHVYVTIDQGRSPNFTPQDFEEALANANAMFAPIGVSFKVCKWEEIPDYNFDALDYDGEFQELRTIFMDNQRINVYIQDDIGGPSLCGFAELSGVSRAAGSFVVLKKECPESLTHELGHLFGLKHTFEGNGTENVDGSNCETEGDGICDTPADPYDLDDTNTVWQVDCEFVYTGLDANGQFYQPDLGNIMSYYGCDCGFTHGQYEWMANTYLTGAKKVW